MNATTELLALDRVTVRYHGSSEAALDQVSLRVLPGEKVALVGPSGAGKTTVLSLANGLVLPTSGNVSVLGANSTDLGARRHRSTRARIGMVHQGNALVGPLRVAQNVAAGRLGVWNARTVLRSLVRPRNVEEIVDVLRLVGIPEKLWDRADQLSGGQQQRVAIARTLFQKPQLVLADEPVSALDPARSEDVFGVLASAVAADPTRALLASLHDAALALRHCSRIVALKHGSVVFDRPAADVTSAELEELYRLDEAEPRQAAQ